MYPLAVFLTCIASFFSGFFENWKDEDYRYGDIADSIVDPYASHLERTKGVQVLATGGSFTTDVRSITRYFACWQKADIPTARRLYVEAVEELVKLMNENKAIRPYLHNYPFTFRNTNIAFNFHDSSNRWQKQNSLATVSGSHGRVYYRISEEGKFLLTEIHEEAYEEALSIIKKENEIKTQTILY